MSYRILSLDGGGTWAMLQALALGDIYGVATPGQSILKDFDMAVANSGGSIVLASLMLDMTPDQMVGLFLNDAAQIFQPSGIINLALSALGLPVPRFSTSGKLQGLKATLGVQASTPLAGFPLPTGPGGQPVKAMISAFDYDRQRAQFFRSFDSAGGPKAATMALVDAVNASADPPVIFFDKPVSLGTPAKRYWDGGVAGYNNPLMAAVVEAMAARIAPRDISVRSIGTGTIMLAPVGSPGAPAELCLPGQKSGPITDLKELAGAILDDPPDSANYVAFNVLGNVMPIPAPSTASPINSGSLVRLSPCIQPIWNGAATASWSLPAGYTLDSFKTITGLDLAATGPSDLQAIHDLGMAWMAGVMPNQPVLPDAQTLQCVIGDPTYASGKARW
jgi:hypothetical protein